MYKLGEYLQSKGGIPVGGSDNNKLWSVFTARDKPILVTVLQYWSGDASEFYQLVQCPPGFALDGTLGCADIVGSIALMSPAFMEGATGTVAEPYTLQAADAGRSGFVAMSFILPPDYSIAVQPVTAASAADFGVRIGGFEIDA